MDSITVFGIPNCDSVKKTLDFFKKNKVEVVFHNYKKDGIQKTTLQQWCKKVEWELLLNKKGTTWKKIAPDYEGVVLNESKAIDIMLAHNSTIKRPVVITTKKIVVGFDEAQLQSL